LLRTLTLALLMTATLSPSQAADKPATVYELRVYTAAPGKFEALNTRMADVGLKLVAKHHITPVGVWTPVDPKDTRIVILVSHASAEARESNWKAFAEDADWKAAAAASEKDGKLTEKVEVTLLGTTDYSPDLAKLAPAKAQRVFELRTYTATPNNLGNLNDRFKDHTVKLFEKYGMTNVVYFNLLKGQPHDDAMLIYFLAHESAAAQGKSFDGFRKDPAWTVAREASEKKGGGSLTAAKNGVVSLLLKPTAYSPLK